MASVIALPTISALEKDTTIGGRIATTERTLYLLRLLFTVCVLVLLLCVLVEASMAYVSTRGTIMNTIRRSSMIYLVYARTGETDLFESISNSFIFSSSHITVHLFNSRHHMARHILQSRLRSFGCREHTNRYVFIVIF